MKFKILLLIISLLTISAPLFAKPLADSVGIENLNGKKVILHKLDPKDNYYSIGRRYKVSPKAIIQFNNNAKMSIGNIIKVPTDIPFFQLPSTTTPTPQQVIIKPATGQQQVAPVQTPVRAQPSQTQPSVNVNTQNGGPITQYKVSAGETLFGIAKRFNTTVDDIVSVNNLPSNEITPDQILQIRANTPPPPAPPAENVVAKRDSTTMVTAQDSSNTASHLPANRFGIYEKDERGVATWMADDGLDPNKRLVLHRTAPIGTVIKITNIMTNRTTFAKVVGRFTDNESTRDVIIVMTKSVATSLGALDKRFQVNISYGAPTE